MDKKDRRLKGRCFSPDILFMADGIETNDQQTSGGLFHPAFEREVANAFTQLTGQIGNLSTVVAYQGITQNITPFDFYPWMKSIEIVCKLTNVPEDNNKLVAYNASREAVSSYIPRYMNQFPRGTWDMLKTELTARLGEVIDASHAAVLLRRIEQKEGGPCKHMQNA